MKNNVTFGKGILTVIAAWFGSTMGLLLPTLVLLFLLMAVESFSGILVTEKETLDHPDSRKPRHIRSKILTSLYRKTGCILTVLAALSMDFLIHKYAAELGIQADNKTLFGLLVTIWFILNELLSILKNAGCLGAKLPKFLSKSIQKIKNDINRLDS